METQTAEKPHLRIRTEALNSLKNDAVRAIVASQFSVTPNFEDKYYDHIRNRKEYLGIYTRWVLNQSSLPPLPTDEELYVMREDILGIRGEKTTMAIDYPLLYLFFDMFSCFIDRVVDVGLSYYTIADDSKRSSEGLLVAITNAMVGSLMLCDAEDVKREGYDSFHTAFLDALKIFLPGELGSKSVLLPADDEAFAATFENEWTRLYPYSDFLYGFEVMPAFSPDDMFRYLRMPFSNRKTAGLSRKKGYKQVMNYVVAMATFKPVPDSRVRAYFRQELCKLFIPRVKKIAERMSKKRTVSHELSDQEMQKFIMNELSTLPAQFDFFYATRNNLQKEVKKAERENQDLLPLAIPVFPLRGRLVKLGHIFSVNEYPFTDYVTQALENKMRVYFQDDVASRFYLDDVVREGKEGHTKTRGELLPPEDEETLHIKTLHIPTYDAKDSHGNPMGWKIKTFAGLICKAICTLRRWDDDGSLKPLRYEIYSRIRKRTISYRAYTRENWGKAPEVTALKAKKARHQV